MRVILGDQSVVITKVLILVFEEADVCVRVVSGSSENSVFEVRSRRACGLAVCSGTREPKEFKCELSL